MASTYVNDLRLEEIADGEQSGTWGATTNTNLELIGEALGFGTQAITTNADTFASTVADGAADAERAMYIKYTGALDSNCTITIGPNTISRMHFIENATTDSGSSGPYSIIISQGSGANVTIPNGDTKAVYLDGAGSGAAVVDAFASLNVIDLKVQDDLTLTSDSAVITFGAGGDATLTHTNDVGLTLNSTNKLMFNDASQFIQGSSATVLSFGATNEIDLTATAIDINGTVAISGDTTLEDGADIITASAGTSNVRVGVNAGSNIQSGGNENVVIGDEAGASLTTGDSNVAVGKSALSAEDANGTTTAIGYEALKVQNAGAESYNVALGYQAGVTISTGIVNTLIGGLAGDRLDDADQNVAVGYRALTTDQKGSKSTAIGHKALEALVFTSSTDSDNVAVGFNAGLSVTTGINNTLIGSLAGDALSDADNNVAVGKDALSADTLGSRSVAIGKNALKVQNFTSATDTLNTAVGHDSGKAVTTGINNTLIGALSGDALTSGGYNTAVGVRALSTEDGHGNNVAIGYEALTTLNAGADGENVAVGLLAGTAVTTGIRNVLIGSRTGDALTDADSNVAVGYLALSGDTLGSFSTAIGKSALGNQNFTSATNSFNTAVGVGAGEAVTTGIHNTLIGALAGDALTDADTNTAIGSSALTTDTLGSKSVAVGHSALEAQNFTSATTTHNTAVGADSGKAISTGTTNSTFGSQSGAAVTTGTHNVLIGSFAGAGGVGNLTTGLRNILIGHGAGQNNGDDSDNIAIGYETNCQGHANAIVMGTNVDSVASNTFTFGKGDGNDRVSNGFTSNATFARVSDVRYKKEIKDNDDCGLDFINDLRPVTFKWKAKSEISTDLPDYDATKTEADHKEKLYGLIAQEVKEALDKNNITDFGGWEKEKTSGINKVAQAMFIYPLIKAVQELSAQVTALTARVTELEGE